MTKRNSIRLNLALAALSIGIVACQGTPANNSAYVPNSAQMQASHSGLAPISQAGTSAFIETDAANLKVGPVVSSCGEKVNITLAGLVNCSFHEKGYAGRFRVTSHMNGIATISPKNGTATTKFTVTGLLTGSGDFVVDGGKGDHLVVHVKVGT
jgi:hypothetical protein